MKNPCQHFARHRDATSMKQYARLCARIVYPTAEIDVKVKATAARCGQCADGGRLNSMLCCCFDCATFGCLTHLKRHFEAKNHCFGVSARFGELYCQKCNDFIFDHAAEKMRRHFANAASRRLGLGLTYDWNPGRDEVRLMRKYAPLVHRLAPGGTRGLRGLVNLGNSCFMNCIIQAMIHIPMLRDYFLTDQHNCRDVRQSVANQCLMCELSNLIQEFYCGNNVPFVPHRLLHMVWAHAQHLAGYEQHDAHEFFISALDILHKHAESKSAHKSLSGGRCGCIIDRLFTGQLQSDLTCSKCGRLSTTVDPYWDISLQLNDCASARRPPAPTPSSSSLNNHSLTPPERSSRSSDADDESVGAARDSPASSTSGATPAIERSLEECLENYVKCERMDVGSKIRCDKCGSYEESVKQLTLRKLPMVICFHLKRFEHLTTRKTGKKRRKIRARVNFPEFLDMTPYTTAYRDSCRLRDALKKTEDHSQRASHQHSYPTRQRQQRSSPSPVKRAAGRPGATRFNNSAVKSPTGGVTPRRGFLPMKRSTAIKSDGSSPAGRKSQSFSPTRRIPVELSNGQRPASSSTQHLAHLANRYALMAVVNHNGTTDSGHYTCHIRHHHNDWYNCNDHIISRERIDKALNSEGYLLFYCKMFIDYD